MRNPTDIANQIAAIDSRIFSIVSGSPLMDQDPVVRGLQAQKVHLLAQLKEAETLATEITKERDRLKHHPKSATAADGSTGGRGAGSYYSKDQPTEPVEKPTSQRGAAVYVSSVAKSLRGE